jgi:hypothetical protein
MIAKNRFIGLALIAALVAGCGDDNGEETSGLNAEACEHMQGGPPVAVTATPTAAGAPAIANDHQRYDVTLVPVTGGNGGAVTFAAAEATDYVFFLDAAVPLTIRDPSGATVTPEETVQGIAECTEVKSRILVPLTVGTHTLQLGPATGTIVRIVAEEAAAHAH